MRREDRRLIGLEAAGVKGREEPYPGRFDPGFGRFLDRLRAWRSLSLEAQSSAIWAAEPGFEAVRGNHEGRLRVGLWCPCLGLGGAEVWQLALAGAVDPAVISWTGAAVIEGRASTDPRMASRLEAIMPVGYGLSAARELAAASDVIISWAIISVSDLLKGLESPPAVVVACHFPSESPWGPGTEAMLERVDRFVGVSELAVESIPSKFLDRVEVIWNAVDAGRLEAYRDRPAMRQSWGVPPRSLVAGYLGRLSPEKDPWAMIRLGEWLPEPWHVVIVGEGREQEALAGAIGSKRLDRVHLVGGDLAAGDVLNGFDTLVVPSHYESFGLTLAEGFWVGLPVVATRSGLAKIVPRLVREVGLEADGFDLASAVLADQNEPNATRARVAQARAFAHDRLTPERFGRDWTELLTHSASRRREVLESCPSTTSKV